MKYLILTFLISLNLSAQSVIPKSKVGKSTDGLTIHSSISKCEAQYSEPCIRLGKKGNYPYMVVKDKMVEDQENPIYSKSESEACLDEQDCQTKLENKSCLDKKEKPIMNLDNLEVYCSKITGYKLKDSGQDIVVVDESKKQAYEAELEQKSQEKQLKKQRVSELKDKAKNKTLTNSEVQELLLLISK